MEMSRVLRCSFCEKKQSEVKKLIFNKSVYICDECVYICFDILQEYDDTRKNLIVLAVDDAEDKILELTVHDFLEQLDVSHCNMTLKNFLLAFGNMSEELNCRKRQEELETREKRILEINEQIERMTKALGTLEEEKLKLQQG